MMEGADLLAADPEPVYASMASFFKLPSGPEGVRKSMNAVHIANFPESRMFFDMENPINAFKIFYMAKEYYKGSGALAAGADMEAESVINVKALEAMAARKLFPKQANTVISSFNKQAAFDISDLESQKVVLAEDVEIYFDAQQVGFDLESGREEIRRNRSALDKIAEQMAVLGTTVVKLIGHLDTSKTAEYKAKGQQAFIEASSQAKLLSKKRAEFIKKTLVERYKCDPERIFTEGKGWEQPVDASDPAKNRRVEVRFLSFE
jgi:outer membrane protein OmpA-like peptidoglycan-associated protein